MRTPITYYGGKQTLAARIVELIPSHNLYCEPFFGGGAVFFTKPKSEVEVINDINGEVINFFKVVKKRQVELEKEIKATLHSRELFKKARVVYENPELFDEVKRAWAFWTLTNQGFAGMVTSWGFGKTPSKERTLKKKREAFSVKEYGERLSAVQIECNDALKVIDRCDAKDTFFYIDPPYFNSDQGHYGGYTKEDYVRLLEKLRKIKGKFLLSSYPSAELRAYSRKYKWKSTSVKKAVAVTKHTDKEKTEMMVMNYEPSKAGKFIQQTESLNGIDIRQLTRALSKLKFS